MAKPAGTDSQRSTQAPPDYRRQLEVIAANATLALFIMDERQHCTYMNPAAERMTGYTLAEVRDRPLHDVVHHTRPDGTPYPLAECPIDRAFPQRMREQGEEVFVHRDGHFYPVAFTASPILEDGEPVGTVIEVREIAAERSAAVERSRLLAERERLARAVELEGQRLQQIIEHAPAAISVTRGPEHVFELVNPAYRQLLGNRDVVGLPLRDALPELAGQGYFELRDELYATGRAHVQREACIRVDLDGDGEPEEHYVDFLTQPLRGPDGAVDGLLTFALVVTEKVDGRRRLEEQASELEARAEELQQQATHLESMQAELEAANDELVEANRAAEEALAVVEAFFDAAPVAAAHLDRELRYVRMNPALAAIDDVDPRAALGRSVWEVIPHAAPQLEPYYRRVLESGEPIRGLELNIPDARDPAARHEYLVNYFPVGRDQAGPLGVGVVALDVTAQKQADRREQVFSQVLEESRSEIYMFDAETLCFERVNRGARENLGYTMEELRRLTPLDLKPEHSPESFARLVAPLREGSAELVRFETVHRRKDGTEYPVDVHLQLSRAGERPLFVALIVDITDRRRAEAERARLFEAERAARERIQVLADAGTALAASLDVDETLAQLARIIVPAIADWCFVEVQRPDGRIEPVAVHHLDPERLAFARRAMTAYPVDPAAPYGTAHVLRTGEPELAPEIPDALFEGVARDAEHLRLLREVGFRSHVSVPLTVRGRVLGVLSLVQSDSGRRFSDADLPFVQDLARKAALALDNARLLADAQDARRLAEAAATRSERLGRLANALNEAATLEEVARVCVVHGMQALDAAAGSLAVLRDDGTAFEIIHSAGYDGEVTGRWRRFPRQPGRPLSDAVSRRAPVLLGTRQEWHERYPEMAPEGVRGELLAFAAVPILHGDQVSAALSFSFAEERVFTAADEPFLGAVAAQAAQALERARLLETERDARRDAEQANRAKAEFLSSMSHELRTPLNAIAGYVDLLELGIHGAVTPAQANALGRIRRAEEMLLSLINDVLNFARIEAGRLEIAQRPTDLLEIAAEVGELVAAQVEAKGLTYGFQAAPAAPRALADAERVRQVLLNLLSNALKFTGAGGAITVTAGVRSGDHVTVTVADTGRGIAADQLEAIFDPFVQVDRHRTAESQQGVGLGLAISRELARAMGGDLTAESTPGNGSAFTLSLPVAEAQADGP